MTKDEQRAELHRTIWSIADDLRGAVDGWDFKQYILGILVYRFLSEKLTNEINKDEEEGFDYKNLEDSEVSEDIENECIEEFGYFIYPSELFYNVREKAMSEDVEELNTILNDILNNIEVRSTNTPYETIFKGMFSDIDTTSPKLGNTTIEKNKKLKAILDKIGSLNLNYSDNIIDAFGDAYEYLMGMYASNAGKSGGEFFTPQEVSIVLSKLVAMNRNTPIKHAYDPACGSGSLLLKVGKEFPNATINYEGQEVNITTYNLCRMNMLLHGIHPKDFYIELGDTLINPGFSPEFWVSKEPNFDAIVSNPPYSVSWDGDDNVTLINDERYSPAGKLAPKSKGDFAFIMHALYYLNSQGAAAIVCFPGIFYRGGAEQTIREYLVKNNYVDTVIALPDNLFFGTSIATCILVLRKNKKDNKVLFYDASKEFVKVTNSNMLSEENINNIVETVKKREDIEYTTHLATIEEIEKEKYNLSVSTYVEKEDTREKIDINVLNADINEIVAREIELRESIDQIIAEIEA